MCSVQLARRVLQLEKLNSSLRQQVSSEQSRASGLQDQVRMPCMSKPLTTNVILCVN